LSTPAKQKEAARRNLEEAREARSTRAHGQAAPSRQPGLSTAEKDRLDDSEFAFPRERKEPLTDARHVRNAMARFDQMEGVSDAERDDAWRLIRARAGRLDVKVAEGSGRELVSDGAATKRH